MRYGHTVMAGLGWAGALGGLALCVLIFLSASVTFDDDGSSVKPREGSVIRLPSVPEAEVRRVRLARPAPAGAGGGQVSPPAGQVIETTGDTLGDAVDTLTRPPPGR